MAKKRKADERAKSAGTSEPVSTRPQPERAFAIASDPSRPAQERIAAMTAAPTAVCDAADNLQSLLAVLRNEQETLEVRLAALQSLQAASFSVIAFEACRPDYIAALRALVDDPEPEIRQRVLGILMRDNDGFAQQRLLEGLQEPGKALVPPEKALQLLSYDPHAEAYPVAREILSNPPNDVAKREALRLLAADATATPLFETVLRNKAETPEIRQIAAAALQGIEPLIWQAHARDIVLDSDEPDEVQATSLMALTQFSHPDVVANDEPLKQRIQALSNKAEGETTKAAQQFLLKYKR